MRCRVGNIAQIADAERRPDSRMSINAFGSGRFRPLEYRNAEPYMTGDIELWEDELGPEAEAAAQWPRARALIRAHSRMILRLAGKGS